MVREVDRLEQVYLGTGRHGTTFSLNEHGPLPKSIVG